MVNFMKNWFKISILAALVIGMVIMSGCTAVLGDDGKVLDVGHEGFDKVADHIKAVNNAKGSALTYHLTEIESISDSYYVKISNLNPDTQRSKQIQTIMKSFFYNAAGWAKYYHQYQTSKSYSDLDIANLYKAKMMSAIDEINNL
jgi:hypothetical protein